MQHYYLTQTLNWSGQPCVSLPSILHGSVAKSKGRQQLFTRFFFSLLRAARPLLLLKGIFNSESYERDPQMGHEKQPVLIKLFIATEINKPFDAISSFSMVCLSRKVAYGRGNILMMPGGKH